MNVLIDIEDLKDMIEGEFLGGGDHGLISVLTNERLEEQRRYSWVPYLFDGFELGDIIVSRNCVAKKIGHGTLVSDEK